MRHRRLTTSLVPPALLLALLPPPAAAQVGLGMPLIAGGVTVLVAAIVILFVLRRRGSDDSSTADAAPAKARQGAAAAKKPAKTWDKQTPRLVPLEEGAQDQWTTFDNDEVLVGRVATTEVGVTPLVVDKPTVSRKHARFEITGDQWYLTDLGSGNGTFVNGDAIHGRHAVRNTDVVRFDAFEYRFDWPQDPGAAEPRKPAGGAAEQFTPEGTMITHGQPGAGAGSAGSAAGMATSPGKSAAADLGATAQFTPDMLPDGVSEDKTEALDFAATAMLPPDQRPVLDAIPPAPEVTAQTSESPPVAGGPRDSRADSRPGEDIDLAGDDLPFPSADNGEDSTDILMPGASSAGAETPAESTPSAPKTEDRDDTDLLPEDTGASPFPAADDDGKTEVLANPAAPGEFDGTLMLTAEQLRNHAAGLPDRHSADDDGDKNNDR